MLDDLDKYHVMENSITPWNPLKTISVHFEVWATLHCQTCPNVLKPCEHAKMVYLFIYTKWHKLENKLTWSKCPKTLPVQNQIWTTLHWQLSPFDLNFCGHVQNLKWWHYTKWCIKENSFAWLNLEKSISVDF